MVCCDFIGQICAAYGTSCGVTFILFEGIMWLITFAVCLGKSTYLLILSNSNIVWRQRVPCRAWTGHGSRATIHGLRLLSNSLSSTKGSCARRIFQRNNYGGFSRLAVPEKSNHSLARLEGGSFMADAILSLGLGLLNDAAVSIISCCTVTPTSTCTARSL